MDFESFLLQKQARINAFLLQILPKVETIPQHLHEAMHYVVLNGGKRIRPLLVYATGQLFDANPEFLDYSAGAMELIHAYSLVHDDLPAMDNDDIRRGMPTCHKAFDEATAILVGDALQSLAFQIIASNPSLSAQIRIDLVACLSQASGSLGMAGGQALDLKATRGYTSEHSLELIHHLKTGALIVAAIRMAAITANITDKVTINALDSFAQNIGLCFQIQDDILNAEGSSALTGKGVGTDLVNQKATFTTINGLASAKNALKFYYQEAVHALMPFGERASILVALADYIISRNH